MPGPTIGDERVSRRLPRSARHWLGCSMCARSGRLRRNDRRGLRTNTSAARACGAPRNRTSRRPSRTLSPLRWRLRSASRRRKRCAIPKRAFRIMFGNALAGSPSRPFQEELARRDLRRLQCRKRCGSGGRARRTKCSASEASVGSRAAAPAEWPPLAGSRPERHRGNAAGGLRAFRVAA